MRASDIMTRSVVTVRTATTVLEACGIITDRGITSLPVLDDSGDLVGIVSESDMMKHRMPHDPRSHIRPAVEDDVLPARTVGEVMSTPVTSVSPTADSADLAALMLDHDIRAIPVVDGRQVVGIVSRRDMLRALVRSDDAVRTDVAALLDGYAGKAGHWHVVVDGGAVTIRGHFDDDAHRKMVTVLARTVPGVLHVRTTDA